MKQVFLFTLLILYAFNLYAAPLQYTDAPSISVYLPDDFQKNIFPKLKKVSDIYYNKAIKNYKIIYPNNSFTIFQNKDNPKNSIYIDKKYLMPDSAQAMQVYAINEDGDYYYSEIFFIVTAGKISQVYSVVGYVKKDNFNILDNDFSFQPQWIKGTIALIYHNKDNYTDYDILTDTKKDRIASLIFIPDNKSHFANLEDIALFPSQDVINQKNKISFLIKDRKVLEYFRKYEVEPQGTFHKFLGGAITMKATIYAYSYGLNYIDNNMKKIELLSIPALFQLESDKGYNRSYGYQKSFYKSISIKDTTDYMRVLDSPNGNIITTIDKVYYRKRDILYTPWKDRYVGDELWYGVILPRLDKAGYILSTQGDITEERAR